LAAIERVVLEDRKPDLTLILDLPAETGLRRANARREATNEAPDRFEAEASSFHQKLRQAFLAIADRNPGRCVVIDADRSPDDVERAVWAALTERLPELGRSPGVRSHVA
jgi:dTMP kinase